MARASRYEDHKYEVLALIEAAATKHSKPPTVRQLATSLDVGVATTHSYLRRLAEEGLVEWQPNRHRSLRNTPAGSQQLSSQDGRSA